MSEPTPNPGPCRKCGGERHWTGSRWRCTPCNYAEQVRRRENISAERKAAELARANELRAISRAAWSDQQRATQNARAQAWREVNRERHRRVTREWYQANTERARAAKMAEYYANPEQFYARNLRRKARIYEAVCDHGADCIDAEFLASVYASLCVYCGAQAEAADHFYPLARGGLHCVENVVPACGSCNSRKSARDPHVWLAEVKQGAVAS